MEIERLPEELLTEVISRTSPQDACRAATVCPALRAAADSDAVWSRFLPRDLPRFARKEIPSAPMSSKGLFQRLAAQPAFLPGKLVSMRLDRGTGAKCYTLSARALNISWGETKRYWRWIPADVDDYYITRNRFLDAAQLLHVCWLEIRGRMHSKMLSKNTEYTARMVFKLTDDTRNLDDPFQEASVSVGGISGSTRQVCLQPPAPNHTLPPIGWRSPSTVTPPGPGEQDVQLPRRRADGWMDVELGRFYNEEGDDGEVSIGLMETKSRAWKSGLIVRAIEITTY